MKHLYLEDIEKVEAQTPITMTLKDGRTFMAHAFVFYTTDEDFKSEEEAKDEA